LSRFSSGAFAEEPLPLDVAGLEAEEAADMVMIF
jgi:hypothetical protein